MEKFLKSGHFGTGLPPDIRALLATETPAPYNPPGGDITDTTVTLPQAQSEIQQASNTGKVPIQPATTSLTPTSLSPTSFRPVNTVVANKLSPKKTQKYAKVPAVERPLAPLAPATARPQQHSASHRARSRQDPFIYGEKDLIGLPPEIRVEIYKMVLEDVVIHILPLEARLERRAPHPLTRVNQLIRNEVLPIIHSICPIEAMITDFNFSGMLAFMQRIPPQDEKALMKNENLKIQLCTTGEKSKGVQWNVSDSLSLGRWLRYRADKCRPQPKWKYCGVWPGSKVESAIRRKISRMTEDGKKQELIKLGTAVGMQRLEKPPRSGAETS